MAPETTDGFVRVPNTLIEHSDLTLQELMVYIVLLKHRNPKTGTCFPGLGTIADQARISRATAIRTIKALEAGGVIQVQRFPNVGQRSKPNIYTVSVFDESWKSWAGKSAAGKRRPKRSKGSDSESLPPEEATQGSDSEQLGSDSEQLGVVTPSNPKKTNENKNHEQDLRSEKSATDSEGESTASNPAGVFRYTTPDDAKPTTLQLGYLFDLHIHLTKAIPESSTTDRWSTLSKSAASSLISNYLKQIPRGLDYDGPDERSRAYASLSPVGKEWARRGAVPEFLEGVMS